MSTVVTRDLPQGKLELLSDGAVTLDGRYVARNFDELIGLIVGLRRLEDHLCPPLTPEQNERFVQAFAELRAGRSAP